MMNPGVLGVVGRQAAHSFKRVPPAQRHVTPVKYTLDFTSTAAPHDLFSYNRSFDDNGDGFFSAKEIENASGLDLNRLENPENIERLWDQDGDGKVNDMEMMVAMTHLDYADGEVDGQITEKGRNYVERKYFDRFNPKHYYRQASLPADLNEPPIFKLDPAEIESVLDDLKQDRDESPEVILATMRHYLKYENKPVQDVGTILAAHRAGDTRLEGFPDSFWNYVEAVSQQPLGQDTSFILDEWERQRIQAEVAEAKLDYDEQLQDVRKALETDDKYQSAFIVPKAINLSAARQAH